MTEHGLDHFLLQTSLVVFFIQVHIYNFVKTLFETSVKLGTKKEIVMQAVQSQHYGNRRIEPSFKDICEKLNCFFARLTLLCGRSLTLLTKFCPILIDLPTYRPVNKLINCIPLTFPAPPTYLVLSTQFVNDHFILLYSSCTKMMMLKLLKCLLSLLYYYYEEGNFRFSNFLNKRPELGELKMIMTSFSQDRIFCFIQRHP